MCRHSNWGNPQCLQEELNKPYARWTLIVTGHVSLTCGIVSIIAGCLQLKYGADGRGPWKAGAPIWVGAVALLHGICCIVAGQPSVKPRIRHGFFYAMFGFTIAVCSTTGNGMRFIVGSFIECYQTYVDNTNFNKACSPEPGAMANQSLTAVVVAALICCVAIPCFIIYGVVVYRSRCNSCKNQVDNTDKPTANTEKYEEAI